MTNIVERTANWGEVLDIFVFKCNETFKIACQKSFLDKNGEPIDVYIAMQTGHRIYKRNRELTKVIRVEYQDFMDDIKNFFEKSLNLEIDIYRYNENEETDVSDIEVFLITPPTKNQKIPRKIVSKLNKYVQKKYWSERLL